jgi:hypothetical protein
VDAPLGQPIVTLSSESKRNFIDVEFEDSPIALPLDGNATTRLAIRPTEEASPWFI